MLTLEEMTRVCRDVGLDADPEGYSDEMVRWRERVETEFEAFKAEHPEAVIQLPTDINGLPDDGEPSAPDA